MEFSETGFVLIAYLLAVWVLLGNGLTILAVFRFEKLRTRANMYIVSLAATDALVGLLLFVAGSFYIPSVQSWFDETEFVCVGMLSWGYCAVVCSGFNMCLIALDRFIYIAKPYLYERYLTERNIAGAIVTVWVLAFVYGTAPLYYNTFSTSEHCASREVIPLMYRSFFSAGLFLFWCLFTELVDAYTDVANVWLRSFMFLGFLNSGMNIFIYPYFNKEFRKAMKVLLCFCKSPQQTSVVDPQTVTASAP